MKPHKGWTAFPLVMPQWIHSFINLWPPPTTSWCIKFKMVHRTWGLRIYTTYITVIGHVHIASLQTSWGFVYLLVCVHFTDIIGATPLYGHRVSWGLANIHLKSSRIICLLNENCFSRVGLAKQTKRFCLHQIFILNICIWSMIS